MTFRLNLTLPFAASLALLASSCATIVAGGPDAVSFTSNPSGATVSIDDAPVGTTPCEADVGRKARYVTMELTGYAPATVGVDRELNGWVFGNILIGGIIGLIVDAATNNAMQAVEEMHVELRRVQP